MGHEILEECGGGGGQRNLIERFPPFQYHNEFSQACHCFMQRLWFQPSFKVLFQDNFDSMHFLMNDIQNIFD